MTRFLLIGAALTALAACATPVPDSSRGVGFGDAEDFARIEAAREAELAGRLDPVERDAAVTSQDLAAIGIGTGARPGFEAAGPATAAAAGAAAPVVANNPGLSDEQDFDAVSGRETIESDAERRERQAAAYRVVRPSELAPPAADGGPNIVAYALRTDNAVGERLWRRFSLGGNDRFRRNCAQYRNADEAQRAFLANGGPDRDRLGLDPDGDGFACGWSPEPFRQAVRG